MAGKATDISHLTCRWYAHHHSRNPRNKDGNRNSDRHNEYRNACSRSRYTSANVHNCYPHYTSFLRATGCPYPPVVHRNPLTTRPAGTIDHAENDRRLWKTRNMDGNSRRLMDTTLKFDRQG